MDGSRKQFFGLRMAAEQVRNCQRVGAISTHLSYTTVLKRRGQYCSSHGIAAVQAIPTPSQRIKVGRMTEGFARVNVTTSSSWRMTSFSPSRIV